jgi:polygalacturonase
MVKKKLPILHLLFLTIYIIQIIPKIKFYRFMMLFKKSMLAIALISISFPKAFSSDYSYLYKNLPFKMNQVSEPIIPDLEENISAYGGVGDGIMLNTEVFSQAMKSISTKGGGHLIVPAGVWLTGPIVFQSNVDLHLNKGALILFTTDKSLYPLVKTNYEGQEAYRCQSPISGRNLQNISITGEGSINGSGQVWRALKKDKVTENEWNLMTSNGGIIEKSNVWYPSKMYLKGDQLSRTNGATSNFTEKDWKEVKDFLRPVMVSFVDCKNLMLQGVLFENSPNWNIHPLLCENVIIDHVFVRNPSFAQNGDGLDLESCKNALVINSIFDVGDDGICIKSGKDEEGRKRGKPTENVIVDNCKVFRGHGGFVVGSEMSGGVRNISVTNCQFLGTDVGLRFKSNRGRGGVVENIYISNIFMFNIVTDSFLFDLYYGGRSASEELEAGNSNPASKINEIKADETTPCFRNIFVKDLVSRNARRAMFFNGLPEMNISNINVENVVISATYGAELVESNGIKFKNVNIIPSEGPAFKLDNVKNFSASELKYPADLKHPFLIKGNKTKNISLPSVNGTKDIVKY